jgi:hypothetical protein
MRRSIASAVAGGVLLFLAIDLGRTQYINVSAHPGEPKRIEASTITSELDRRLRETEVETLRFADTAFREWQTTIEKRLDDNLFSGIGGLASRRAADAKWIWDIVADKVWRAEPTADANWAQTMNEHILLAMGDPKTLDREHSEIIKNISDAYDKRLSKHFDELRTIFADKGVMLDEFVGRLKVVPNNEPGKFRARHHAGEAAAAVFAAKSTSVIVSTLLSPRLTQTGVRAIGAAMPISNVCSSSAGLKACNAVFSTTRAAVIPALKKAGVKSAGALLSGPLGAIAALVVTAKIEYSDNQSARLSLIDKSRSELNRAREGLLAYDGPMVATFRIISDEIRRRADAQTSQSMVKRVYMALRTVGS